MEHKPGAEEDDVYLSDEDSEFEDDSNASIVPLSSSHQHALFLVVTLPRFYSQYHALHGTDERLTTSSAATAERLRLPLAVQQGRTIVSASASAEALGTVPYETPPSVARNILMQHGSSHSPSYSARASHGSGSSMADQTNSNDRRHESIGVLHTCIMDGRDDFDPYRAVREAAVMALRGFLCEEFDPELCNGGGCSGDGSDGGVLVRPFGRSSFAALCDLKRIRGGNNASATGHKTSGGGNSEAGGNGGNSNAEPVHSFLLRCRARISAATGMATTVAAAQSLVLARAAALACSPSGGVVCWGLGLRRAMLRKSTSPKAEVPTHEEREHAKRRELVEEEEQLCRSPVGLLPGCGRETRLKKMLRALNVRTVGDFRRLASKDRCFASEVDVNLGGGKGDDGATFMVAGSIHKHDRVDCDGNEVEGTERDAVVSLHCEQDQKQLMDHLGVSTVRIERLLAWSRGAVVPSRDLRLLPRAIERCYESHGELAGVQREAKRQRMRDRDRRQYGVVAVRARLWYECNAVERPFSRGRAGQSPRAVHTPPPMALRAFHWGGNGAVAMQHAASSNAPPYFNTSAATSSSFVASVSSSSSPPYGSTASEPVECLIRMLVHEFSARLDRASAQRGQKPSDKDTPSMIVAVRVIHPTTSPTPTLCPVVPSTWIKGPAVVFPSKAFWRVNDSNTFQRVGERCLALLPAVTTALSTALNTAAERVENNHEHVRRGELLCIGVHLEVSLDTPAHLRRGAIVVPCAAPLVTSEQTNTPWGGVLVSSATPPSRLGATGLRGGDRSQKNRPTKGLRTSKEDENFVSTFFQESRLHHIGSWKERFQEIVESLPPEIALAMQQPPAPPPSINPHSHRPWLRSPQRVIFHVDLDAFFATVAELGYFVGEKAHLRGKVPLAVCHSKSKDGSAEVSSCNYEARKKGVKKGMFIGDAMSRCPDLIVRPYEFEKYKVVAEAMYRSLFNLTPHVHGLSTDEAIIDVTAAVYESLSSPSSAPLSSSSTSEDYDLEVTISKLAETLRSQVRKATGGCTVSVGSGHNRLLARLALNKAKPNRHFHLSGSRSFDQIANQQQNKEGQSNIALSLRDDSSAAAADATLPERLRRVLDPLPLKELPGVGHEKTSTLAKAGLITCGDVRALRWEQNRGGSGGHPAVAAAEEALAKRRNRASRKHGRAREMSSTSVNALATVVTDNTVVGPCGRWALEGLLGPKSGTTVFEFCYGEDSRPWEGLTAMERKSVGAQASWGVRADNEAQVAKLLRDLSSELSKRLQKLHLKGRRVQLKVWRAVANAPDLLRKGSVGHGLCTHHSRNGGKMAQSTDEEDVIYDEVLHIWKALEILPLDIRGFGVTVDLLDGKHAASSHDSSDATASSQRDLFANVRKRNAIAATSAVVSRGTSETNSSTSPLSRLTGISAPNVRSNGIHRRQVQKARLQSTFNLSSAPDWVKDYLAASSSSTEALPCPPEKVIGTPQQAHKSSKSSQEVQHLGQITKEAGDDSSVATSSPGTMMADITAAIGRASEIQNNDVKERSSSYYEVVATPPLPGSQQSGIVVRLKLTNIIDFLAALEQELTAAEDVAMFLFLRGDNPDISTHDIAANAAAVGLDHARQFLEEAVPLVAKQLCGEDNNNGDEEARLSALKSVMEASLAATERWECASSLAASTGGGPWSSELTLLPMHLATEWRRICGALPLFQ